MKVKLYVAAVAAAALAAAVAAGLNVPAAASPSAPALLLFGLLIALAEYLQVRYYHHDEVDALIVMEGMLAPLLLVSSGWTTAAVACIALAAGDALRGNPVVKIVFNVSQWVLAASLAALWLVSVRPGDVRSPAMLGWLVTAMLLMSAVNQVALGGVLYVATGSPVGTRGHETWRGVAVGHTASIVGAVACGVFLSASYLWSPWTLVIGIGLVVGMHTAGRAFVGLRSDGVRVAGLQRATHALATAIDDASGLPRFLAEARTGFEVKAVQLVLFGERGTIVHACTGAGPSGYSVSTDPHPLAEALADGLSDPVHLSVTTGGPVAALLEAEGRNRVLAAPLRSGGTTTGVLFLFDRVGTEGFEDGELKIADALAREVVGFLERVELLQAIDGERRKLADILGNTSDGIFSIDSQGVITSWNAGLAAMTGYPAEEIVGTRHFGLLRPRDTGGRDVLLERWLEHYDVPGLPNDLQIVSASGQTVWLSCSYSRIPAAGDQDDVLVVVARNVTQARELERLKDDFVAVVSHELRTPLVPIKGWAQTLLNRGDRLNDDQRRTAVQSILAQAQKLESLVLNILEASRIEAGRIDGDGTADVGAIASRLVDDLLASRPDREIRLRPPRVPCNVNGSPVWVERAVANLIANAVKYSPDDEPVDVVMTTDATTVVVAVTDRGPGIAPDAQERIFERFERLEETRTQTGTGLGLYITRRLARAMGGDVSVSSVPGAGSTFLLRLPLAPVAAGPAAPARFPEQRVSAAGSDENVVRLR